MLRGKQRESHRQSRGNNVISLFCKRRSFQSDDVVHFLFDS